MNKPDITIISSLYRTDTHIKKWATEITRCVDKLMYKSVSVELIVVANDPTPLELQILDNLKKFTWLRVICVQRESLYASWNRGIQEGNADLCCFWNVDDLRSPDAILEAINKMKNTLSSQEKKLGIFYFPFTYKRYVKVGNWKILVKKKIMTPIEFNREEFIRSMHTGPFFIFTQDTFDLIGGFDPSLKVVGDFEWCARAATLGIPFIRCEQNAGTFHNDGTTLSGSKSLLHTTELIQLYEKNKVFDKANLLRKSIDN
jgi:GT2 family glycosyltransferase